MSRCRLRGILTRAAGLELLLAILVGCDDSSAREAAGDERAAPANIQHLTQHDDVFVAGEYTEEGLAELKEKGVQTIIDLRLEDQVRPGDPERVRKMGMNYVAIPMRSDAMTDDQANRFLAAMEQHDGERVLVHCGSANRAGAMYGLYAGTRGSCPVEEAIEQARKSGMRDPKLEADLKRHLNAQTRPAE